MWSVSEGPGRVSTPYCFLMSEDSIWSPASQAHSGMPHQPPADRFPLPSRSSSWVEPRQADWSTCHMSHRTLLYPHRANAWQCRVLPQCPSLCLPFLSSSFCLARVGPGTDQHILYLNGLFILQPVFESVSSSLFELVSGTFELASQSRISSHCKHCISHEDRWPHNS